MCARHTHGGVAATELERILNWGSSILMRGPHRRRRRLPAPSVAWTSLWLPPKRCPCTGNRALNWVVVVVIVVAGDPC